MPIADIDFREYLSNEKIDAMNKIFKKLDVENENSLSENDVYIMFKKLGKSLTRQQLREVLRYVDSDDSGRIEFEELCVLEIMMSRARPRADLIDYNNYIDSKMIRVLEEFFVRHDLYGRGTVSVTDLEKLLEVTGVKVEQEELEEVLLEVNKDSFGELEFSKFAALWAVLAKRRKKVNYREFMSFEDVRRLRGMFAEALQSRPESSKGNDALVRAELDYILKEKLGLVLKKTQLTNLIKDFDTDQSGDIDFEEFCIMYARIRSMKRNRVISPETCDCRTLYLEEKFSVPELQRSGFGLQALQEIGIPVAKLHKEGQVTALEFRRAGYTAEMLRKGGLGLFELRAAGFSLMDLRAAGFSAAAIAQTNRAMYNALSSSNLSVLPQQRPILSPAMAFQDGANLQALRPVKWVEKQPLTPRIRDHTDWLPVLRPQFSRQVSPTSDGMISVS